MPERVGRVMAATSAARDSSRNGALDALAAMASALPTSLITRIGPHADPDRRLRHLERSRAHAEHVCTWPARRCWRNYPVGPLLGVAFNVTMMSYCGSLGVGLHCDTAAVTDPGMLKAAFGRAFAQLVAAATS